MLLIEQLAAGDPVDLGAQLGDAVFVAELHLRLPGYEPGQDVLPEGEIGGRGDGPHRHDHQRSDHHPESDRSDAERPPGVHEDVARGPATRSRERQPAIVGMACMTAVVVL